MEEPSDLVAEAAFNVSTAVGWDTAKDCRAPRQTKKRFVGPQRCGRAGHRVDAVSYRRLGPVFEEDKAQATGYTPHTASCINNIPVASHTTSPYAQRRKLCFA